MHDNLSSVVDSNEAFFVRRITTRRRTPVQRDGLYSNKLISEERTL